MTSIVIIALLVYVAILIIITYYSSRKESSSDFIIAGKKLRWKSIGLSTFASLISSFNIVIGITFAFLFGVYVILVMSGVYFAFLFVYFVGKKYREESVKGKFITIVDHFRYKYGNKVATLVNLVTLFVLLFFITLQINVNTLVFSNLLSWPKAGSALFVVGVVLLYSLIGGFKTVVKTDVFQGIMMLAVVILAFLVGTSGITSENIVSNLSDTTLLFGALALAVGQFLSLIVQPELWQRVYAAKSSRNLKLGLWFATGLSLLIFIPEVIIGMSVKYTGAVTDAGNAFYEVLSIASPGWLFPIVAVALFAAFMSSLDSSVFALSSQLAKTGFVSGYKDEHSDKRIKRNIRVWMIGIVAIALILSLFLSNFLTGVFQLLSLLTIIGTAFVLSFLFKLKRWEMFTGLIVGTIAFVAFTFSGIITQKPITVLYPSICLLGYVLVQRIIYLFVKK